MRDQEYDVTSVNKSLNLLCIYSTSNFKVFLKVLSTGFTSSKKKWYWKNKKKTNDISVRFTALKTSTNLSFSHVLRKMQSYGSDIPHCLRQL